MHLLPIDRRSSLTREEFAEEYLKPKRPVVLTDLAADWPAIRKWTFDYLIEHHGHLQVPISGAGFHAPGPNYMKPQSEMPLGEYLQIIRSQPTELRLFLWNILDHAPELKADVSNPDICGGWVDSHPFMFFGGQGAATAMHYDIDCSHVFHTHFWTRKHIVLFDQTQSPLLYQHPFTVQSAVNPIEPDFEKHPAARHARGFETMLGHGETLFIPSMWWHYIKYVDGGFSLSLRARDGLLGAAKGLFHIAQHFTVDKGMNALAPLGWKNWKERQAQKKAQLAAANCAN